VDDLLMLSIKASNNKIWNKTNKEGRHLVNESQNTTKHHRHGALQETKQERVTFC
jgi:hypothetical protein